MRFLVPRVSLIRLLQAVCGETHPLLRIEASAGCVTPACGDIEVRPSGIRVGRTRVSRAGWEISLFANPSSAPKRMRLLSPAEDNASDLETQMLLPFVTPRALKPTPPPAQRGPEKL
jgi:hypothetical protein